MDKIEVFTGVNAKKYVIEVSFDENQNPIFGKWYKKIQYDRIQKLKKIKRKIENE